MQVARVAHVDQFVWNVHNLKKLVAYSMVEDTIVVEAKFQIVSKIHGAHKEFMIAPRLSEMHRALREASAPNKRISGKIWHKAEFRLEYIAKLSLF